MKRRHRNPKIHPLVWVGGAVAAVYVLTRPQAQSQPAIGFDSRYGPGLRPPPPWAYCPDGTRYDDSAMYFVDPCLNHQA